MTVQYKDLLIKHLPDDLPLRQAEDHPVPNQGRWDWGLILMHKDIAFLIQYYLCLL